MSMFIGSLVQLGFPPPFSKCSCTATAPRAAKPCPASDRKNQHRCAQTGVLNWTDGLQQIRPRWQNDQWWSMENHRHHRPWNIPWIRRPNIKQNGARVTPVVIQWVDLFAVKTVWSSCHQSLFFSYLGYLDRFQQSAVLTFYLTLHLEPQRGSCLALYPAFHKEDLNSSETNWRPVSILSVWKLHTVQILSSGGLWPWYLYMTLG